jgi:hypothetical protein
MNPSIFYPLLMGLPLGFLAIIVAIWKRFEDAKGLVAPIKEQEKFLRAPGYSASKKIEALNEEIDDTLFWFTALPALVIIGFLALRSSGKARVPYFWEITVAIAAITFVWLTVELISRIKERRRWQLGFRGERAVGEYLNRLMLDGCRIFHDFPLNGAGNLDHIVVAPSGVYAIETRTKSKHSRLENNYKVVYDGKTLAFAEDRWNTEYLRQARDQANQLANLLADELKTPIEVEPILTLPGWFVDRRGLGEVRVLNQKEISPAILSSAPPALSPEQIQKIAAYLDARCRDVAF